MTHKKDNSSSSPSGEIWVNSFNEKSARDFRSAIQAFIKRAGPHCPLVIYIDSPGGAVDALSSMIQTMDSTPNPIVTVCIGKAMSCGAILLSHGDYRFCSPHGRVMVHEVSAGTIGDVHDNLNNAAEAARLNKQFLGLLALNCNIEGGFAGLRRIVKEHDGRNIWMSASEAAAFGIVDNVGMPSISVSVNYDISIADPKDT